MIPTSLTVPGSVALVGNRQWSYNVSLKLGYIFDSYLSMLFLERKYNILWRKFFLTFVPEMSFLYSTLAVFLSECNFKTFKNMNGSPYLKVQYTGFLWINCSHTRHLTQKSDRLKYARIWHFFFFRRGKSYILGIKCLLH